MKRISLEAESQYRNSLKKVDIIIILSIIILKKNCQVMQAGWTK